MTVIIMNKQLIKATHLAKRQAAQAKRDYAKAQLKKNAAK
jgi:hypothetical protein